MIADTLRAFFTRCWLAIAYPAQSGSTYTQKTPQFSYDGSIAGRLKDVDRRAMKEHLQNKYGIPDID